MTLSHEDKLIGWLRNQQADSPIGDDAAILSEPRGWAVTVDQQLSGVHFPPGLSPRIAARRLFAVSTSDLAAMGARPRFAFLALAAPDQATHKQFLDALNRTCAAASVQLAGGDMARSTDLGASLTLLGSKPSRSRWLRRSNARVGDRIWLGGSIGDSAAGRLVLAQGATPASNGVRLPSALTRSRPLANAARSAVLRHLAPTPQVDLGLWLGRRRRAAAIDVSDGLSLDLHRLCGESGVGAEIHAEALPGAPNAGLLAEALGRDPLDLMLSGGEDYVLLFTLPATQEPPPRLGLHSIGRITKRGVTLIRADRRDRLRPQGWDHLRE